MVPYLSDEFLAVSPFAWWEWDVETNSVRYNDLKTPILGYVPCEFVENGYQSFTELIHPEDREKGMEAMRSVLYGALELYQVDHRIRAKDGSSRWFMSRWSHRRTGIKKGPIVSYWSLSQSGSLAIDPPTPSLPNGQKATLG